MSTNKKTKNMTEKRKMILILVLGIGIMVGKFLSYGIWTPVPAYSLWYWGIILFTNIALLWKYEVLPSNTIQGIVRDIQDGKKYTLLAIFNTREVITSLLGYARKHVLFVFVAVPLYLIYTYIKVYVGFALLGKDMVLDTFRWMTILLLIRKSRQGLLQDISNALSLLLEKLKTIF